MAVLSSAALLELGAVLGVASELRSLEGTSFLERESKTNSYR
ncbi:hypothetical protein [Nodosilinea sp. FACHB-141]|nr:hypothetical protein [Nodosilinea sp. FACHB-141]